MVSSTGGRKLVITKLLEYYHQALAVPGNKKSISQIWDTVSWELSSIASQLFLMVDRQAEFLRTVLEKAGLVGPS